MSNVFSIVCYVVAGFFFYTVMMLSFVKPHPLPAKLSIIGVFAMLAAVSLLIGLAASRFRRWQRDTGVVLVSSALATLFLVLTFICMLATPEYYEQFGDERVSFFSDYISGGSCIASILALGGLLLWQHRARRTTEE